MEIEDVSKAYQLFIDVRRSTQFLIEYQARAPRTTLSSAWRLGRRVVSSQTCAVRPNNLDLSEREINLQLCLCFFTFTYVTSTRL